jgi:hypothetical protein
MTCEIVVGEESKTFLLNLTNEINRLEKVLERAEKIGEGVTPLKDAASKEEALEEVPIKLKKKKTKKVVLDDVLDACKKYANKHGFESTRKLLVKKFNITSVQALKPEQYEQCIKVMCA